MNEYKQENKNGLNYAKLLKQHETKSLYTKTLRKVFIKKYINVGLTIFKVLVYDCLYRFCQIGRTEVDRNV